MKKKPKTKEKEKLSPEERTEFLDKLTDFLRTKDEGAMVIADCTSLYVFSDLNKKELKALKKELTSVRDAAQFALVEVSKLG